LGTAVRALVIHEGATYKPWQNAREELGEISQFTPAEVERSLAAASPKSAPTPRVAEAG